MYKILITCLGNICRSPAAQHLIINRLDGHELDERVKVDSAGLVNPGNKASKHVRRILVRDMGIDSILDHRSKIVTPSLIKGQDLILPMGRYEMEGLLDVYRHPEAHLYLDWIYDYKGREVEDPYGGPFEKYCRMVRVLGESVDPFISKLRARSP